MSRNKFVLLLVIVALLMGTLSSVMAQSTTLTVWADAERAPALQSVAGQVEADLGITLNIVEVGFGDIRDQLLVAGPVGEGPDVLIGAHDWLGQLVSNGAVMPIELGDLEAEFAASAVNAFTFNGQVYGVPYAIENVALVRNVDLVPERPTTWQEVRALAEQFAAEEGAPDYAFIVQTGDAYHNFPITSAFGGYIFGFNEDGSYNVGDIGLGTEGGLAAAEWLSGMYVDGLMPTSVDSDVAFALFQEGRTAMIVTGPWFSGRITETGLNYSIDPMPGAEGGAEVGAPFSGVQGFMISAFSQNQLLAEVFLLDYVASVDFMQVLFDTGKRPPVFAGVDTSAEPNIAGFQAAGANAVPMPSVPEMGAVWGAAGNALTLVSQGEPAVATYEAAVQQIVEAIGLMNSEMMVIGVPGSHQSEAGCSQDWDPACQVTLMSDDDGDGIYTLTITLPAGDYEYKVALDGGWAENYGADGVRDGANIVLSLAAETEVTFSYDPATNVITDNVNTP